MFDKQKFSEIFKSIYNKYDNQRDFASATGVNRAYISQYMNMKLENPPTPKILKKIADNSKGVTTYEELMEVCGYKEEEDKIYSMIKHKLTDCINNFNKEADSIKLTKKYENIFTTIINIYSSDVLEENYHNIEYYTDILYNNSKESIDVREKFISLLNLYIKYTYELYYFILGDSYKNYIENDVNELFDINTQNINIKPIAIKFPTTKQILHSPKNYQPQTIKIPVVGTVAAGEPILAQQNIVDYEELPASEYSDGEYFGLKIKRKFNVSSHSGK